MRKRSKKYLFQLKPVLDQWVSRMEVPAYIKDDPIQFLHTPGHTPGAICLHAPGTLISGDTLFPGGPGRTESPEKFSEIVENIENKLLHYDDETMVMPGHGLDTILAVSKSEYEIFKDKTHPKGLFGHISWLTS